jgi:hypothetical protein
MYNGETFWKQEKEGSKEKEGSQEETNGGDGNDSQEGATSEFKKVLVVEKNSKQDEPPSGEEVKPLVFVEPIEPPVEAMAGGSSSIVNIVKPSQQNVLKWLCYRPSQDLAYDQLSQDTCCSSQDTCSDCVNPYWADTEEESWGDSEGSWGDSDDSY